MTGRIVKNKLAYGYKYINYILILVSVVVLVMLLFRPAAAKEPQFHLNIDETSLEKGVSTNLVLSVENAQGAEVLEVRGLNNFDILSERQSSSTQIINGDISRENKFTYVIMPLRKGEYTLKGIVKYKGKKYETNQLGVIVKDSDILKENEIKELFIKSIINQEQIYFGEKFALGFELYSRYNIENFGFVEQPDLTGFISLKIPQDKLRANYLQLDGKKYVKYEVGKSILTPTGTGSYTVPASTFQVNVSTGNFFDSSKAVYLQTEPVEIEVKALPLDNQPDNFEGLVGELEIESSFSKQELEYGDSLTLKVKLSGNCNLDNLDKIFNTEISGVSIYETEKNSHEDIRNGRYYASKEFDIIIVPDKTGQIMVPTIEIPYFNSVIEQYEKARVEGAVIKVNGDAEVFSQNTEINEHTEPTETIRIEKVNYTLANNDYLLVKVKRTYLKTGLYIIVLIVLMILILLFSYKYWRRRDDRLKEIYNKVKKENDENEIFMLLNEMIKYKFNVSLKAVSRERLKSEIENKEILQDVLEVMDYLENKRYAKDLASIDIKDRIKKIYRQMV